jgi:hypothetical protein
MSVGTRGRQVAVVGQQRRREVAGDGRAIVASLHTRGRALVGTRGHGLSWAAGKRALPLKLFP